MKDMKLDFFKIGRMADAPIGASMVSGTPVDIEWSKYGHGVEPKGGNGGDDHPVLDFDHAREVIALFDEKIKAIIAEAEAFEVVSDETAREATERAGEIKALIKRIEDRRKELIAEPDGFTRKVNQAVKPRRDKLETGEKIYKRKLGDFTYRQELERREILRKQEEERVKLQAQIDAEAKAKGVESVQVAPVALPAKQGPTRSESATASSVMVWDFEVIEVRAVPREYLVVDDALVRMAIKAGIREIPGVRVFERAEVRVRRIG